MGSEMCIRDSANSAQLRTQSIAMAFYFVGFAIAVYTFLQVADLGAVGLVWANCVNMACRIIWNGWFISQYCGRHDIVSVPWTVIYDRMSLLTKHQGFDISELLPSSLSIAASAVAATSLRRGARFDDLTSISLVNELVWPALVTVTLGAALLIFERRFLLDLYRNVARR